MSEQISNHLEVGQKNTAARRNLCSLFWNVGKNGLSCLISRAVQTGTALVFIRLLICLMSAKWLRDSINNSSKLFRNINIRKMAISQNGESDGNDKAKFQSYCWVFWQLVLLNPPQSVYFSDFCLQRHLDQKPFVEREQDSQWVWDARNRDSW